MIEFNVIASIGLERAIPFNSKGKTRSECEDIVFEQARDFGVDSIYFNKDDNGNSFPAVFLKRVKSFDRETLQSIADTHKKIWNYKKVLFLYVYSDTEIRIYNCAEKPLIKKENLDYEKELQNVEIKAYQWKDKGQLEELNRLFSRIAIDSGIVWTLEDARFIRDKIRLQRRVDKYLVDSLVNTANQLKQLGLEINFIHKIILRSLFLLYLEDRGATDVRLYAQIKKGAKSYFDILEDVEATYQLYERLEEYFNGNVFTLERDKNNRITESITREQLQLIKKCFTSGNEDTSQLGLFPEWRLFDFNIIQIELLSEIYENFLFNSDPKLKKKTGTYYTPPSLVEFMLNEKLPTSKSEKNYNVKVLDPSCGSGIFLVQSFKRLVKRYENHHKEKLTDFNELKKLLTDNIFGIEVHPQAIKVAAFSLYLALVDSLDPKSLWQKKRHRLPYLINNPNDETLREQGSNLYCRDTIEHNEKIESIGFDLIVGNPPFGTTDLSKSVRYYCEKEGFAKEMVLPFLHKATQFSPHGKIALIFNTKVLTNTEDSYQNFRRWLFNDCYVEKVFNFSILRNAKKNFGGQLFGDATGPISIVFYQKKQPENPSDKIAYYAPKTFIKTNVIDGLTIDYTDLKYLPREECQKSDTKIWKIAMWGNSADYELCASIGHGFDTLTHIFEQQPDKWIKGTGLLKASAKNLESDKGIRTNNKIIDTKKIIRYYTNTSATYTTDKLFNPKDFKKFTPPFLLVKEGQQNWMYCATIIDYKALFLKSAFGIKNVENDYYNKVICALINSNFAKYYLSLISSSWGIERERVQPNEILMLPYIFGKTDSQALIKIAGWVDKIIDSEKAGRVSEIAKMGKEIDKLILKAIGIDNKQKDLILDTITYSLDLLENKEESIALNYVLKNQIIEYAQITSSELNNFLNSRELFVNATVYDTSRYTPLIMIKLSHGASKRGIKISAEQVDDELQDLDKYLWKKETANIYFRKKLNYKKGNDFYIIRPNQRRFWSKSMALEDASELILEILNGEHDEA